MVFKRKIVLYCVIAAMLGATLVVAFHYLGIGHHPRYPMARVAWWQSPGRIGATIGLNPPEPMTESMIRASVDIDECVFENDRNRMLLGWRFMRNSGDTDIYRFRIQVNDQDPVTRTVAFDGQKNVVLQDPESGTALTIEPTDLFPDLETPGYLLLCKATALSSSAKKASTAFSNSFTHLHRTDLLFQNTTSIACGGVSWSPTRRVGRPL